MSDWLANYATELASHLNAEGSPGIAGADKNRLLEMARDVAHATERKNAPLATFLAGYFTGLAVEQGMEPGAAVAKAVSIAAELIDPLAEPTG